VSVVHGICDLPPGHLGTAGLGVLATLRSCQHLRADRHTYTPFALLYLHGQARAWLLGIVWGFALVGLVFRVAWVNGPRWLFTLLYIALGWVVVFFIPQFIGGAGRFPLWVNVTAISLVAAGGVLYTLGGLVYATKRPDPSPVWFGFHEVFHLLTVLAFIAQYVAVSVVTYSL